MAEDVHEDPDRSRYTITVDGRPAGFTSYHRTDGVTDFRHTEISDEFEGRGLGSTLIAGALDDERRQGFAVLPHCPFVQNFIAKHREYVDLVPADRRAEFDLD